MTDTANTPNAEAEIYWRPGCGYCAVAMELFLRKNVDVQAHNIWEENGAKEAMLNRTNNAQTVPQIFIRGKHIGGAMELIALEKSGELDRLLNPAR